MIDAILIRRALSLRTYATPLFPFAMEFLPLRFTHAAVLLCAAATPCLPRRCRHYLIRRRRHTPALLRSRIRRMLIFIFA